MKALKKNGLAGGLVALLAVAVLGLFSLTGCANTSEGASGPNQFLGEWIYEQTTSQSGVELTQTFTWNFRSDGICTYTVSITSVPGGSGGSSTTYEYTASGDTATLNYNGATMTITLRPDGKSFLYGGKIYTKQ